MLGADKQQRPEAFPAGERLEKWQGVPWTESSWEVEWGPPGKFLSLHDAFVAGEDVTPTTPPRRSRPLWPSRSSAKKSVGPEGLDELCEFTLNYADLD